MSDITKSPPPGPTGAPLPQSLPGADVAAPPNDNLTWGALGVALVGSAGTIYLSVGMGLVACPLCFYQRAFILAAFGTLAVGLFAGTNRLAPLSLLALPAAVAGLALAAFHVNLERVGKLECPGGLFGLGSAPQQSLGCFAVLTAVLLIDLLWAGRNVPQMHAVVAAILGGAFAWACIASAPPMPPKPEKAYDAPPKICRPPYTAPAE
jgi:disulfide bond formation protein DsbB